MRYVFGFLCVCALGVMPLVGCSETTGDGGSGGDGGTGGTAGDGGTGGMAGDGGSGGTAGDGGSAGGGGSAGDGGAGGIQAGTLWLGGNPNTNTDGSPLDTGWAICFFVNEDGTALIPSTKCDIDGNDDEAYMLEVSWKDDVGRNLGGEVGLCDGNPFDGSSIGIGDSTGLEVPIEDNSFVAQWPVDVAGFEITGTFNGDTATGTAGWDISLGMGADACALDGGWTASPVVTDCAGEDDLTPCERSGEFPAQCIGEVCLAQNCSSFDDHGIPCMYETPDDIEPGACSDGSCVIPVEDCTGEDWYTTCRGDGRVGYCFADLCVTAGCSGQEDGTYCNNPVLGAGFLGVCEAEECTMPEDCTGIADGVNCTGGTCEAGECVSL